MLCQLYTAAGRAADAVETAKAATKAATADADAHALLALILHMPPASGLATVSTAALTQHGVEAQHVRRDACLAAIQLDPLATGPLRGASQQDVHQSMIV